MAGFRPKISSIFCHSIAWAWALEMNGSVKMFQSVVCAFAIDADDTARIEAASQYLRRIVNLPG
jgi:hypothetical protein